MNVFLSVISHGHGDLIKKLGCLASLAKHFTVVVKLNLEDEGLTAYCDEHNVVYIDEKYGHGFGANNNIVFSYCKKNLEMQPDDLFIVFNPDVLTTYGVLDELIEQINSNNIQLAGVNLFKDKGYTVPDNSIRHFPTASQFVKSFLGFGNTSVIDKLSLQNPTSVDWAAGSFLAFKSAHYESLKGFDERYFMYCEDIDICYRSALAGINVVFLPSVKMQHLAEHANRSILSKHFYWHVKSVIRFLLTSVNLTKPRSSVE